MNNKVLANIPKVDEWTPQPEDIIFTNSKGILCAPVAEALNLNIEEFGGLNYFIMNTKKCYNSQVMREHTCLYLNYFEKYYDSDKELALIIYRIKYLIDTTPNYDVRSFIYDEATYILNERFKQKVNELVDHNYSLTLEYKNIPENLQYNDNHAKIMLRMSLFMNFCIPLITHYAYIHKIGVMDDFIMQTFDIILNMYPEVNIYSKLYETTYSNVSKSEIKNAPIWQKQDIRGKDAVTHSYASVSNIILNIMPKYTFDKSIISLNFTSITKNTSCQVLDIEYEFNYISLSSSKRDAEDNSSDFDKFESNLIKSNEATYIQSKMNAEETMNTIDTTFGPFDPWEIEFCKQRLKNDKGVIINSFQKQMIFNLFYKNFGDSQCIYGINSDDYVKLMLAGKQKLIDNHMIILPYIISGKVEKLIGRKTVNKKEMCKLEASSYYEQIINKYHNDKIIKHILSMIATIISSDFSIIDFNNKEIDGKKLYTNPDMIIEEVLAYTLMV